MRCAHAHSYDLYCAQGLPYGFSLKNKAVSESSFISGKAVKEELNAFITAMLKYHNTFISSPGS